VFSNFFVSDVLLCCDVILLFAGCKFLHTSEDSDTDVAGERRDTLEGCRVHACYAVSASVQKKVAGKISQTAHTDVTYFSDSTYVIQESYKIHFLLSVARYNTNIHTLYSA
jgi:hypothetical protein